MKHFARILSGVALAAALFAAPGSAQMMEDDIVTVASEAGSFSTLTAAIEAAGLVEVLQEGGPFTVFAPTDEAFAKLPEGTVAALLENPAQLALILKEHVVSGEVVAEDVMQLTEVTTLNGSTLPVRIVDGKVMIGGATVVTTNVNASNGVIHVIDTVIVPAQN